MLLALALSLTAGCTYEREGPPSLHFSEFKTIAPEGNTVTVCHAYGCQRQTPFTFTAADLSQIAQVMDAARVPDTAHGERRAIAQAMMWIERRVGAQIGTSRDRASMDFTGSGNPSQQDCVDEATNATSYLMVLARNGLLRHHTVERPFAKGNLLRGVWPHWAAVIREKGSGQRYAVDTSERANGRRPDIELAESWYMDSAGSPRIPAPRGTFVSKEELRASSRRSHRGSYSGAADPLTTGRIR